ncbi:MAG: FapA family protein [Eubacterium sp.]|nr:FapA family protein [Eubacterium sp.]
MGEGMKNSYFQVICKNNKTYLQVTPGDEGCEKLSVDEITRYIDFINIDRIDVVALKSYIDSENYETPFLLSMETILPEREHLDITVKDEGRTAIARFYPPAAGGDLIDKEEIISDIQFKGVIHGIDENAVDDFIENRQYCTDYVIARATEPIEGYDASIEYFFDITTTVKPKLNEDGSVDFHQLGNIKAVEAGDMLARLTPAMRGKNGIDVRGKALLAKKVNTKSLRYGRNISISEDKCTIYSMVSGHVSLVEDLVMVSDIYELPANVDTSTGDIDYNGSVKVNGNVNTGYSIRATGDIIINGAVEGADIYAGGNIVILRGMQGMSRGRIEANGNITAKFIENSQVVCGGDLKCDALLHSDVECKGSIAVLGRKGLINGGNVRSYGKIEASNLGSNMGSSTKVELISGKELSKQINSHEKKIDEARASINKLNEVLEVIKESIELEAEVKEAHIQFLKTAISSKPKLLKEISVLRERIELAEEILERTRRASINVGGKVYSGVKISIHDVSLVISKDTSHCKFVRDGADIRSKVL